MPVLPKYQIHKKLDFFRIVPTLPTRKQLIYSKAEYFMIKVKHAK